MTAKTRGKQSFMMGVVTLLIAQIVVKFLGLFYRIFMTNMDGFGDVGNGLYSSGYQIYTLLLAVSSIGVPNAIAKLVSERIALGKNREAHDVFKISMLIFALFGGCASVILFVFSENIANLMGNSEIKGVMMALAPGIFFVSVSSVIRGYFNGMYDMKATSNSQILEQFLKSVLIIVFLQLVSCISLENIPWTKFGMYAGNQTLLMAIAANAASTLATVLSCVYLIIFYQKRKKQIWMDIKLSKSNTKVRKRDIIRRILAISLPISFASIISALNKNIDTFTVVNCLKISLSNSFSSVEAIIEEATRLYGILSGKVDILIGMPVALNVAFATALVPAISSEVACGDAQKARQRINFSIRMTVLIALSCAVGMSALAGPILKLLFPNAYSPEAILLLQISSISIVFLLMNQTIGGILQGLGKAFVPAISLGAGVIIKLVLNLVLIPSNNIGIFGGINGSAISTIIAQCVAMLINLKLLSNNIKLNINLTQSVIKPIIVSVLLGGIARFVYTASIGSTGYFVSVLLAITIAIIAFLVFVIFFKIFDEADYHMLPFGKKLYNFFVSKKDKNES